MNKSLIGIILIIGILILSDTVFSLVPFIVIIIEIYSFYLDYQPIKKQSKELAKNLKLTWQQLSEHNTQESAYVAIKNKIYDVTNFLDKHPGGKEFILMNAGRDATHAFQCYHPFSTKPAEILEKYYVGELITNQHPLFKEDSGFYKECSTKIQEYFKSKNINPKTPLPGLLRAIPLWMLMVYTFYYTFIRVTTWKVRLIGCTLYGILQGLNTLHLMHDASHGAVGNNEKWWWGFGRLTLDYISGSSMLAWHNQHVIGHHIYTNIMGSDPDVPQKRDGDVRRIVPQQVWNKIYLWQQYYMPILYGLLSLRSRYYDIFEIFLYETNGPIKVNPISLQNKLRQAATKILWLYWRYYLPVRVCGMDLKYFIFYFLFTEFVTGYWLAVNFQVSHISDEVEYFYNNVDKLEKQGTNERWSMEWAKLQVKTSVDYAHDSWLMTYLCGALNYQVVHHLYPGISQYLYPQIAPIIKEVCNKHDLKYHELRTFNDAWKSHINHLRDLGQKGKLVEISI